MYTSAKRFDKLTWFPDYPALRKLHDKIYKTPPHNEIGPGGVLDVVIEWVLEANRYYQETQQVLQYHYVPRLTSYSKQACIYETLFLRVALALWRALPNTTTEIGLVSAKGNWITLLMAYNQSANRHEMPPAIAELEIEAFIRPEKKILKQQQSMKTIRGV